MTTTDKTSLKTVREQAAKTIMELRSGKISPVIADAIYKQSLTIVDSYRVEMKGVELAIANSKANIEYKEAKKLIN